MDDKPCTFLVHSNEPYPVVEVMIKANLKKCDAAVKARALKRAIVAIINGDSPRFRDLSTVIVHHVLPCEDLTVQKLVLLYLEAVYKGRDVYGRVPPDTDLVRDHLRRNLQHGDAYVRGLTLRFIGRLAHPDLLEPLVESVLINLYHRHRFVRRHAYSAISAIYLHPKPPNGRQLFPDALDCVAHELNFERDASAMRNALFMLWNCKRARAVSYLLANADRVVTEWPDIAQVLAIVMMQCACCSADKHQGKLLRIIVSLSARSNSNSVIYEAADALLSLCFEPLAVCAAANAYFKLLFSPIHTDVKHIVLERLHELGSKHNYFVKTIGSPCPSPNPSTMNIIEKKVRLVELYDMTQMHIDSVDTIGRPTPNVMNIKSPLPIAEKVVLVEFARKQGDKVEESNGRDTQLMHSNESGSEVSLCLICEIINTNGEPSCASSQQTIESGSCICST